MYLQCHCGTLWRNPYPQAEGYGLRTCHLPVAPGTADEPALPYCHRQRMMNTLRTIAQLQNAGLVSAAQTAALERVAARYAVAITPAIVNLIDRNDPSDPIARQFIPDPAELDARPQERPDPIGDDAFSPVEGIVHRYPDRVLLKLLHTCPVYCRFCFRREMVGPGGGSMGEAELDAAIAYIRARPR